MNTLIIYQQLLYNTLRLCGESKSFYNTELSVDMLSVSDEEWHAVVRTTAADVGDEKQYEPIDCIMCGHQLKEGKGKPMTESATTPTKHVMNMRVRIMCKMSQCGHKHRTNGKASSQ